MDRNNQRALEQMLEEAVRTGWPQIYRDDLLVHDKNTLEALSDTKHSAFQWMLRPTGTQLALPEWNHFKDFRRVFPQWREYRFTPENGLELVAVRGERP